MWPGVCRRAHLELAEREPFAGLDALHLLRVRTIAEQLALALADQRAQARPAFAQLADLADVVEMMVGEQHVRGRQL